MMQRWVVLGLLLCGAVMVFAAESPAAEAKESAPLLGDTGPFSF